MKEQVEKLVKEAIEENPKLFLIELKIGTNNNISVVVDGDEGVNVKECIRISRHIEHNLDREVYDFSLEVSSPGLTEPFVNTRQYNKNIGRTLEVKTTNDKFEGSLVDVNDKGIVLEWKVKEPKPIGKGKITVEKTIELPFESIKQTKVKLKF